MNNCISPLDNFAYLGNMSNEPVSQEENCDRVAVPGGGDMLSGGDPRVNM